MEFTVYRIDNNKNLLKSSLKNKPTFKVKCWLNPREHEIKQTVVKVAIRCSNSGKRNNDRFGSYKYHLPKYNHNFCIEYNVTPC